MTGRRRYGARRERGSSGAAAVEGQGGPFRRAWEGGLLMKVAAGAELEHQKNMPAGLLDTVKLDNVRVLVVAQD